MRIPNPRGLRLGGLTQGTITERGDGELIVTSVRDPIIQLPASLDKSIAISPLPTIRDTVMISNGIANQDATVAIQTDICVFGKGLWKLDYEIVFQMNVAVPGNTLALFNILFIDPDGIPASIFRAVKISGTFLVSNFTHWVLLQRDGAKLQMNAPAILAGDTYHMNLMLLASRQI
jgi:hypothetical protein